MRIAFSRSLICAATLFVATAPAAAETFVVDTAHTTVGFSVRHLFTTVQGRFDTFAGKIDFDPKNPASAKVEGRITASSINTNNAKRDTHLRSDDFFAAEKFPEIKFVSSKVTDIDSAGQKGKLHGVLTIRDKARPIVLDVAFLGSGQDPYGNAKAGFSATTTIDRKEFGLSWNEALETGGFLVGDEVTITINAAGDLKP